MAEQWDGRLGDALRSVRDALSNLLGIAEHEGVVGDNTTIPAAHKAIEILDAISTEVAAREAAAREAAAAMQEREACAAEAREYEAMWQRSPAKNTGTTMAIAADLVAQRIEARPAPAGADALAAMLAQARREGIEAAAAAFHRVGTALMSRGEVIARICALIKEPSDAAE